MRDFIFCSSLKLTIGIGITYARKVGVAYVSNTAYTYYLETSFSE